MMIRNQLMMMNDDDETGRRGRDLVYEDKRISGWGAMRAVGGVGGDGYE